MDINLIKRPVITEKSTANSQFNKYVFEVRKDANKTNIKKVVEDTYKVKVESLNSLKVKSKPKVFKGQRGSRSELKRIIVTLKEGNTIDMGAKGKIMGLITYKPTTPSFRKTVKIDKSVLFRGRPLKELTEEMQPSSGRNNTGKITIRHRSGGHKKKYRIINFKRNTFDKIGTIERIEYDPNRSGFIALVDYQDLKEYILAPSDIKIGDKVISSSKAEISSGNSMQIKNIPTGTSIHNIELKPGAGGKLCRSAGAFAQVLGVQDKYIMIKMSSRETRLINGDCMATIGVVSNQDNKNKKIGKAGIKRHLGIRPTVRGVAMNPVDHPHGGGEGRTSGGRHPTSPWGLKTKGKKTRKIKFTSKMIIARRVKK